MATTGNGGSEVEAAKTDREDREKTMRGRKIREKEKRGLNKLRIRWQNLESRAKYIKQREREAEGGRQSAGRCASVTYFFS